MSAAETPLSAEEARAQTRRMAMELLDVRDRTVREMRERLARRGCPAEAVDAVVADLEAVHLLDDRAFVRRWVESRRQRRPEGAPKIVMDLVRRRIDREVIAEVLAELDADLGSQDEALALLRRQRARYETLDETTAQRRMLGMLARRGFGADTACSAAARVWAEIETGSQG